MLHPLYLFLQKYFFFFFFFLCQNAVQVEFLCFAFWKANVNKATPLGMQNLTKAFCYR